MPRFADNIRESIAALKELGDAADEAFRKIGDGLDRATEKPRRVEVPIDFVPRGPTAGQFRRDITQPLPLEGAGDQRGVLISEGGEGSDALISDGGAGGGGNVVIREGGAGAGRGSAFEGFQRRRRGALPPGTRIVPGSADGGGGGGGGDGTDKALAARQVELLDELVRLIRDSAEARSLVASLLARNQEDV